MSVSLRPAVGFIVHYHNGPNAAPLAAIVTHVWPGAGGRCNLAVFSATGGVSCASGVQPVPETPRLDFWSWPPGSAGDIFAHIHNGPPLEAPARPYCCRDGETEDGCSCGASPRDGSDGGE